jgi:hypothetical protein
MNNLDWTSVAVALIAFAGTFIGSIAGIRASNRLVEHRLLNLEEKVDKHNNLVERMTRVETRLDDLS